MLMSENKYHILMVGKMIVFSKSSYLDVFLLKKFKKLVSKIDIIEIHLKF